MANSLELRLPEEGFVRLPTVLKFIPVGTSTWYRGIKDGKYPKGIRISGNVCMWDVDDIRKLINQLKSGAAA